MELDRVSQQGEKLVKAWRFFYKRGFLDGFGHISARLPSGQIVVSRHSLGPTVSPSDFVIVDTNGKPVTGQASLPGETPIHLEIYRRRSDVGSIGHFHCSYATAFAMSERVLEPSYFLAAIFRNGIPIHEDPRLVLDSKRGSALAETLGGHRAALMRAHGVVVAGADVEEMVAVAFILEDNARRICLSAALGSPLALEPETARQVEEELLATRGPFRRIWSLCEDESKE
jgi:ribulose-5-phosphate 4-epimerase/fuculose-1-phosphate aldolase